MRSATRFAILAGAILPGFLAPGTAMAGTLAASVLVVPVDPDAASAACHAPVSGEPDAVRAARAYAVRKNLCAAPPEAPTPVQGSVPSHLMYHLSPSGDVLTPESAAKAIRALPEANRGPTFWSMGGAGFRRHNNFVTQSEMNLGHVVDRRKLFVVIPSYEVLKAVQSSKEWVSDPDRLDTGGRAVLVSCQGGTETCTVSVPVCQGVLVRFTTPPIDDPKPLAGEILAEYAAARSALSPACAR
jgi:hypothetical protein